MQSNPKLKFIVRLAVLCLQSFGQEHTYCPQLRRTENEDDNRQRREMVAKLWAIPGTQESHLSGENLELVFHVSQPLIIYRKEGREGEKEGRIDGVNYTGIKAF